jgi:type I restriction enzyme S subunit
MVARSDLQAIAVDRGLVGGPFGSNLGRKDYVPEGIPVVRGTNMGGRYLDLANAVFVSEKKAESDLRGNSVLAGDICVTQRGTLGQVSMCPASVNKAVLSQSQMRLRVDPAKADAMYVLYAMQCDDFQDQIKANAISVGVPHINLGLLARFTIPLPDMDVQRRIAGVLGNLDDLIDTNRSLIDALSTTITIAFEELSGAFNGEREPFGAVAEIVGGATPSTAVDGFWGGGLPWVTPKDLSKATSLPLRKTERTLTREGIERISSGLLPKGTVLMSSRAPIGYLAVAEVPVAINQGFIALKETGRLPSLYMVEWLRANMSTIISHSGGTTFKEISKTAFRPLLVDVPPANALARFQSVADPIYRAVVELEGEIDDLVRTRDELLPLLMSGRVVPGEVA